MKVNKIVFMKKIIIAFLFSLCISLLTLTGCSIPDESYSGYKPEYGPQFMLLESYHDPYLGRTYILVDKNSRVMYLLINYDTNKTDSKALTILYDSEGKVRRYMGVISE